MTIAYVQSPEFVVEDDPHVTPETSNFLSKVPRDVIVAHYSGPMAGNANINGLSWFGVFVGKIYMCRMNINIPGIFLPCRCFFYATKPLSTCYQNHTNQLATGKAFSKCILFLHLVKVWFSGKWSSAVINGHFELVVHQAFGLPYTLLQGPNGLHIYIYIHIIAIFLCIHLIPLKLLSSAKLQGPKTTTGYYERPTPRTF